MKQSWLTSKETKEALKLSDCELMHERVSGKIKFKKIGNAYYYDINKSKKK